MINGNGKMIMFMIMDKRIQYLQIYVEPATALSPPLLLCVIPLTRPTLIK
jgi:hypothetical protein